MSPEAEAELRRVIREELTRMLAPARADDSLRARLERAQQRDRAVLDRLRDRDHGITTFTC